LVEEGIPEASLIEEAVIRPFLISDDLNNDPASRAERQIVFFGGMELDEASKYPNALEYVRKRVKPYRDTVNRKAHRERWWRYGDWRPGLYKTLKQVKSAICVGITAKHYCFNFIDSDTVFDQTTVAFPIDSFGFFAVLSSTPHTTWARLHGAKMGKSPRYNPTRCFETFPFPPDWETNEALEEAGRSYYEYRAALMVRNDEGLTKTYNRFHDPEERSPEIQQLRALHAAMDRAIFDAYGWPDIPTACEFLLDYEEEDEETETTGKKRQKKKPYRLRWPDEIRDEVLARLLALNAERAAQEKLSGTAPGMKAAKKTKHKKSEEDFQLE